MSIYIHKKGSFSIYAKFESLSQMNDILPDNHDMDIYHDYFDANDAIKRAKKAGWIAISKLRADELFLMNSVENRQKKGNNELIRFSNYEGFAALRTLEVDGKYFKSRMVSCFFEDAVAEVKKNFPTIFNRR